ncbi:hypothetical protein CLV47_12035 [Antricoccus suffuscus]|uniref:Uncharacterized protein n=1 Tax=Antricoccus suffuscus TaxID=1629062 RepID=A0A2T0ZR33_9ACTN|nr:hypothetical protein CLV47_12035 [Antricoccus suffuscus]
MSSGARSALAARVLIAVVVGFFAVFTGSLTPAGAEPSGDADAAAQAFESGSHVYVSPDAGQTVDAAALKSKIGKTPLFVAVVAPNQTPEDVAKQITTTFNPSMTIAVISGTDATATSTALCEGDADKLLESTRAKHAADIAAGKLTTWLSAFADDVASAPSQDSGDCGAGGGSSGPGSVLPWMIGIGVLGLAAIAYYVVRKKKQKDASLRGRRTEVTALYDRLGADVRRLDPAGDAFAAQALADASERYDWAGATLSAADTDGEFDAARAACLEGLTAARAARKSLGLDLGEDIPRPERPQGERLDQARQIQVRDETYVGHPRYTPGAPHYYRGGPSAPAGWYAAPFWDNVPIASMLGGGLFGGNEVEYDAESVDEADEWDSGDNGGPTARGRDIGDRS